MWRKQRKCYPQSLFFGWLEQNSKGSGVISLFFLICVLLCITIWLWSNLLLHQPARRLKGAGLGYLCLCIFRSAPLPCLQGCWKIMITAQSDYKTVYMGLCCAQGTAWGPGSRGVMWSVTLTKTTPEETPAPVTCHAGLCSHPLLSARSGNKSGALPDPGRTQCLDRAKSERCLQYVPGI